ncbi:hypothetical protein SPF06_07840 [Sinomonas sp. JGH33]|uniref:ABC-2 type transporter domain-containing protein n=1 Tax=Sinomonas terricola TaxID=3110330 RepID=A0ABU5T574_9MICC|nr:hypothetical protein [Sinomonas sp. JGH33]MEA5454631.1 hypothetical protein [Sinomonas sp. JGH33]
MSSALGMVARTAGVLWVRELAGLFRTRSRTIVAAAGGAFAAALALGVVLALAAAQTTAGSIPQELASTMLRTAFSSSAVICTLIVVVLAVSLPARTSLQSLLDLLPVGRTAGQVGQLVPVVAIAATFGLALSATAMVVSQRLLSPGATVLAGVLLVGNVVSLQMIALGVFQAFANLLKRYLRLPHQYAVAVGAAVVMAAALLAFSRDVLEFRYAPDAWSVTDLLPPRLTARLLMGADGTAVVGIAGWWAAASWRSSREAAPIDRTMRRPASGCSPAQARGRASSRREPGSRPSLPSAPRNSLSPLSRACRSCWRFEGCSPSRSSPRPPRSWPQAFPRSLSPWACMPWGAR